MSGQPADSEDMLQTKLALLTRPPNLRKHSKKSLNHLNHLLSRLVECQPIWYAPGSPSTYILQVLLLVLNYQPQDHLRICGRRQQIRCEYQHFTGPLPQRRWSLGLALLDQGVVLRSMSSPQKVSRTDPLPVLLRRKLMMLPK